MVPGLYPLARRRVVTHKAAKPVAAPTHPYAIARGGCAQLGLCPSSQSSALSLAASSS